MLVYFFSLSLFGSPLFSNVAQSTITPSYKPENVTNRWFNGQPSVYIQQVTHSQLSSSISLKNHNLVKCFWILNNIVIIYRSS